MATVLTTHRHKGGGVEAKLYTYKAGETNSHGNEIDAWEPEPIILKGCAFDPGSSAEPRRPGQERVIVEPNLFAPYGAPAGHKDKIEVLGKTYLVEGEARHWRSPFTGRRMGTSIGLRRVDG